MLLLKPIAYFKHNYESGESSYKLRIDHIRHTHKTFNNKTVYILNITYVQHLDVCDVFSRYIYTVLLLNVL